MSKPNNLPQDVLVIGAGLSGLTCAYELRSSGLDVKVIEASNQAGGRIRSVYTDNIYAGDLGPTWVWRMYQPIIDQFLSELEIQTFGQYETGLGVVDVDPSQPVRHQGLPGQHGIARIVGGPQAIIDALQARLEPSQIEFGLIASAIDSDGELVSVQVNDSKSDTLKTLHAKRVVIAMPLRLLREKVALPSALYEVTDLMDRAPTWMAVQAKATILYEKAFWRERGLSGRVVSHIGPMFEVHDHCNAQSGQAALFGFIAWPPEQRAQRPDELRREIRQQLIRCFGEEGGAFSKLIVQDWAQEQFICSDRDLRTQPSHPDILPAALREPQLNDSIHFAVSETADISPGLIEGAIQSGKRAAASILK